MRSISRALTLNSARMGTSRPFTPSMSSPPPFVGMSASLRRVSRGTQCFTPVLYQQTVRRTLFVEIAQSIDSVSSFIQGNLISLHETTGLPWWATLACSTVVVRLGLLPLARLQILESRKFGKAMPEINFLIQLLRERLKTVVGSRQERLNEYKSTSSVFRKGVRASFTLNDVSPSKILGLSVANIAVFATFVYSVKGMIQAGKAAGLETGGLLWFADLTTKDPMLAVLAVGASYAAVDISFGGKLGTGPASNMGTVLLFKDVVGSLLILMIPMVLNLPAGVFCYWIPSSMCGAAQALALRNPTALKLLRIPPLPVPNSAGAAAGGVNQAVGVSAGVGAGVGVGKFGGAKA